jgi:hypothetical protein
MGRLDPRPIPASRRVGYGRHPRVKNGTHAYPHRVGYPPGTRYPYPNCHPYCPPTRAPPLRPSAIAAAVVKLPVRPSPPPAKLLHSFPRPIEASTTICLLAFPLLSPKSEPRRERRRGLATAARRSRLRPGRHHQSNPGEPNRTSVPRVDFSRPCFAAYKGMVVIRGGVVVNPGT